MKYVAPVAELVRVVSASALTTSPVVCAALAGCDYVGGGCPTEEE